MAIQVQKFQHRIKLPGDEGWRKVDTYSASHESDDPSQAKAHNFPSKQAAVRALHTYRYAAHQQ